MAERTEATTLIEAEPEDVMEVLVDVEAYPEWAGVSSARILDTDEEGRPSSAAFEVSAMGFDASYTLAYSYAPDDGGMAWAATEAGGALRDVRGEYALEEDEGGTRVTYRLEVDLAVAVPSLLRRQAEKRIVSAALEGLKRRVEEG